MMDFLPEEARPYERSILILYHFFGITRVTDILSVLGYKDRARIMKTLQKYRGKIDASLVQEERRNFDDDGLHTSLIDIYPKE